MADATDNRCRTISLQVFLHCTLGGFEDVPPPEPETTIVRMYLAGRPLRDIVAIADTTEPTIYKTLRREKVPFRSAA